MRTATKLTLVALLTTHASVACLGAIECPLPPDGSMPTVSETYASDVDKNGALVHSRVVTCVASYTGEEGLSTNRVTTITTSCPEAAQSCSHNAMDVITTTDEDGNSVEERTMYRDGMPVHHSVQQVRVPCAADSTDEA